MTVLELLIALLIFLGIVSLPGWGIFAYYKHDDTTFHIMSMISAFVWLLGIIFSFLTAPAILVFYVIAIPLAFGLILTQADRYNTLLLASCFGAYATYVYVYLVYSGTMRHWGII